MVIPSFTEGPESDGDTGKFPRGPNRVVSKKGAASATGHLGLSREIGFPGDSGEHILPDDLKGAIFLEASRSADEVRVFRIEELNTEWDAIKAGLSTEELGAGTKINTPQLAELLDGHAMGGRQRVKQPAQGFPITGQLAGPGVYPAQKEMPAPP